MCQQLLRDAHDIQFPHFLVQELYSGLFFGVSSLELYLFSEDFVGLYGHNIVDNVWVFESDEPKSSEFLGSFVFDQTRFSYFTILTEIISELVFLDSWVTSSDKYLIRGFMDFF